jgi:Protein of unknown function (DUF3306)
MSEPEGFLSRWTRLKREAGETPEAAARDEPSDAASPDAPRTTPATDGVAPAVTAPPEVSDIDLSALPAIDSITAATDIRGFLAPGVPADLTRAALRRAWVADPKIRDFIGIAENQWDFTAADAMPGFGPLGPLDDVRRMVARVMGDMGEEPERPEASAVIARAENAPDNAPDVAAGGESLAPSSAELGATRDDIAVAEEPPAPTALPAAGVQCSEVTSAPHKDERDAVGSVAPTRRGHGGALPK